MNKQQIAEAVARLDALPGHDTEGDHCDADEILRDCVPLAIRDAYDRVKERNGAWWYA